MADSVVFDGTDDYIRFDAGSIVGGGAQSCVVIVKFTADTAAYKTFFGWNAMDAVFGVRSDNPGPLIWYPEDGPSASNTIIPAAADGWMLLAATRPDGLSQVVRYHRYIYGTAAWTHENEADAASAELPACTRYVLGCRGDLAGNFFNGNMLIAGWWDSVLSDGDIEDLITGQQAWIDASPAEAVRLDSLSTLSAFVGTSTEQARVGTTLATGDVPAGWTDASGGTDATVDADTDNAYAAATASIVAPPKPRPSHPFTEINVRM